ncbi:MAG: MFS transporter, partial [Caldanaerobacter sp.]
WLFAVMLGFYVASELGVGNWFVTFLSKWYGMGRTESSVYLSIFFATFTFGRLFGGFLVEKIGYRKSLVLFSMLASTLIFLGISFKKLAVLISLSGFFYSIIFPTVIAVIMKSFRKYTTPIIGITITTASTINMIANFLIGKLNDIYGVFAGFSATLVFMLIVFLISLIVYKREKRVVP